MHFLLRFVFCFDLFVLIYLFFVCFYLFLFVPLRSSLYILQSNILLLVELAREESALLYGKVRFVLLLFCCFNICKMLQLIVV